MTCNITVEDVKNYLGAVLGTVISDERIQLFLNEAIDRLEPPCNCDLKTVAYYILNQLFNLGEITNSPNDNSGIKKKTDGSASIEYAVESQSAPLKTSTYYKGLFEDALTECQSRNGQGGICGNIFIA